MPAMPASLQIVLAALVAVVGVVILVMWLFDQWAVEDPRPQWHQQLDEEVDGVQS